MVRSSITSGIQSLYRTTFFVLFSVSVYIYIYIYIYVCVCVCVCVCVLSLIDRFMHL